MCTFATVFIFTNYEKNRFDYRRQFRRIRDLAKNCEKYYGYDRSKILSTVSHSFKGK